MRMYIKYIGNLQIIGRVKISKENKWKDSRIQKNHLKRDRYQTMLGINWNEVGRKRRTRM